VFAFAGPKLTKEPPQLLVLSVDGKEVPVRLGQGFEIEVGGRKVKCVLKTRGYRVFESGGVRFRYPEGFAFTCDEDDGTCWLESGDTVIMFQSRPRAQDPEELLETMTGAMVGQYGPENAIVSKISMRLAERPVAGRRIDARILAGQRLRQEVFVFQSEHVTCVLMQQTMPQGDAVPAASKRAFDLLRDTFELAKK
jgi:hypothetical protein